MTRNKTIIKRNRMKAYAFLAPNFIGFIVFTLIPVIYAFLLSFMKWDSATPAIFVGLSHYIKLFKDTGFRIALLNTVYYTTLTVPLTIVFALSFALILNEGLKGIKIFRALHFFPHISSVVAVAVVWQFLYHPDFGPINMVLKQIGIASPPRWTSSVTWAMPAVIIMSVWKSFGYYMIMFIAGLKAIPIQLYEAAKIDGAGGWKRFIYVTLPMISPTMFFVVIISIISSFKVFTQVYIMTEGGPGRATSVLVYKIYTDAFKNFNFGYASAEAVILFLFILIVTIIQYRGQEKWVYYMS